MITTSLIYTSLKSVGAFPLISPTTPLPKYTLSLLKEHCRLFSQGIYLTRRINLVWNLSHTPIHILFVHITVFLLLRAGPNFWQLQFSCQKLHFWSIRAFIDQLSNVQENCESFCMYHTYQYTNHCSAVLKSPWSGPQENTRRVLRSLSFSHQTLREPLAQLSESIYWGHGEVGAVTSHMNCRRRLAHRKQIKGLSPRFWSN